MGAAGLVATSCFIGPALAASSPTDLVAYVRARAADADGNTAGAASGYARALAAEPDNAVIAVRSYRAALAAGDMALATRSRLILEAARVAPADAAVLALAEAVRTGDQNAVGRAISRIAAGPLDFLAPSLAAWSGLRTSSTAIDALNETVGTSAIGKHYSIENRALLTIAKGRVEDGLAMVRLALGLDRGGLDLRIAAAQLLAGQSRQDLALDLLAGDDRTLAGFGQALGKGVQPSPGFGVTRVLLRLAADLGEDDTAPLTISLARAALGIEPDNDRARLLLAGALAQQNSFAQALKMLAEVNANSPYATMAATQRVGILEKAGKAEQALAAAIALTLDETAVAADFQLLGDQLILAERFSEAVRAYQQALDRAGVGAPWVLYLQLGAALEQDGQWAAALPLLEKAVALAPDQPVALNYLGYAQIEHGGDIAAAVRMLTRASAMKPDDLSILDSLAWGYFRQGDVARALPLLERAAEGEPANATINDHLGDVYWANGRLYEARYAWQAAIVTANKADSDRIAAKIASDPARN